MPSGGAISTAAPASSTRSATRGPIISSPPTRSARLLPRLPSRDDRFPDGEGRTHRPCQAAELHIRRQGDDGIGGRYARLGPARQWRAPRRTVVQISSTARPLGDRKSVVKGKRVSVRVNLGGGRNIKKKKNP